MINHVNVPRAITKTLSPNDTGETGGHQAGMLIPKGNDVLNFFPALDKTDKNPRIVLSFKDNDDQNWDFSFIYYNNRFFGGTRNEYRLTGMTGFIRSNNLKAGDSVLLYRDSQNNLRIGYTRENNPEIVIEGTSPRRLKLSNSWTVITI